MLNIDYQKDRFVAVLPENFIDLDVVRLEGVASGVPADELLLLTDLDGDRCTFFIMSSIDSWKR